MIWVIEGVIGLVVLLIVLLVEHDSRKRTRLAKKMESKRRMK